MKSGQALRAVVTALATSIASPVTGEAIQCEDPAIRVTGVDAAIRERTCHVASRTRKMLATCGMELNRAIEINLSESLEGEYGPCLGIYHCGEDKLEILTPAGMAAARESDGAFGSISDKAYWESVIAHELTHAAYDTVPCPFSSCIATNEYASYAMQVWSLPEAERDGFGEAIELRTKPTRDAISAIMLFMSPDRFAVIAWRHFQSRPDPCGYMQSIMQGDIFFDREPN